MTYMTVKNIVPILGRKWEAIMRNMGAMSCIWKINDTNAVGRLHWKGRAQLKD